MKSVGQSSLKNCSGLMLLSGTSLKSTSVRFYFALTCNPGLIFVELKFSKHGVKLLAEKNGVLSSLSLGSWH